MRPTKVIVDLDKIRKNVNNLRGCAEKEVDFMAVVKANAYGHGIEEVSKTALKAGAAFIGVSIPDEGVFLRKKGVNVPVLVLGGISGEQAEDVILYDLTQTVSSIECASILNDMARKYDKKVKVHIKLDTGMGRIGLKNNDDVKEFIKKTTAMTNLEIEGVFTHFALADHHDPKYTLKQLETFNSMLSYINELNINPRYVHAANSAAILRFKETHFNLIRGGISMYGYYPSNDFEHNISLLPALKWVTKIVHIKTIDKGESVSYGRDFIAKDKTIIATLPVGYGDGYMRHLSNKGYVLIKGKKAPIAGRVCMDQVMVDVTNIPDVAIGDEVVLLGNQDDETISADKIADICNTISYEVLTNISSRVPREYINE